MCCDEDVITYYSTPPPPANHLQTQMSIFLVLPNFIVKNISTIKHGRTRTS